MSKEVTIEKKSEDKQNSEAKETKRRRVNKGGRPTRYSIKMAEAICAGIAAGDSLRTVCSSEKMPDKSTVLRWLALPSNDRFRDQYARAKEASADVEFDELKDIAEDAMNEVVKYMYEPKLASAIVQAHRLKADNIKWSIARKKPKVYGDKIEVSKPDEPEADPLDSMDLEDLLKLEKMLQSKGKK